MQFFTGSGNVVAPNVQSVGAGNAVLLSAVRDALNGDKVITFLIYGVNVQYATESDNNATPAVRPALVLTETAVPETAVPEPASASLLAAGGLALLARRRRA